MKHLHILIFSISLLLIMFTGACANAQVKSSTTPTTNTIVIKEKYGLRVGADISKSGHSFFDDDYSGFEIAADYRLKKRLYIAGEIGFDKKNTITDFLDVTSKGNYIKAGIDYNLYENWLNMDNMIYSGFRIGVSSFTQNRNSFSAYTTNQYWAPQFTSTELTEFKNLTAIWAEIIFGMKVELFNNFYLGLNAQLKIMASETTPDNFENIFIPGFNKTYDDSRIGVGFNYTLSYRITFYKKEQ